MKFQQWPKRDPDKNYFKVPNEVFHIGLSYPEISIYCYLLSIEDRDTYQCYPSYKTIGKALGSSGSPRRRNKGYRKHSTPLASCSSLTIGRCGTRMRASAG